MRYIHKTNKDRCKHSGLYDYGDIMYTIRKYKASDKPQLRYICKETASDDNKKNPAVLECIPIIFNDYFTENEPENIFVAADENDTAVGYVICCTDFRLFRKTVLTELSGRIFKIHPPSLLMLFASLCAVTITKKKYRTHLHIDLLPSAQRQGLGTKLIDALCMHLKEKGIRNVSVMTISKKSMGYKFYSKYGFKKVGRISHDRITMTYDIR